MYCPPRPRPLPAVAGLIRALWRGDGDLLALLPAAAYRMKVGYLGYSRRSTLIVNDPELVRGILDDPNEVYPKSDLMVMALEPLIGNSIFVSSGATWRRQRRMIDPAFSHMRLGQAFGSMDAAVDDYERRLDEQAHTGTPFSLDLAMSHLTADVICRTVFSTSLQSQVARDVFESFTLFERSVAQVQIHRLILDAAWTRVPQKPQVEAACRQIRMHLGSLLDSHIGAAQQSFDDIASAVVAARDLESTEGFTRDELIDQLGVMFLAGHETTASALTWVFYVLATQRDVLERMRAEVDAVAGTGPVLLEHTRRLGFIRSVFRETLRLYPPITFLPRVALARTSIGPFSVKRGALIMIAPWTIHRHHDYWDNPHAFDPDRFSPARERDIVPGSYLPFGLGPRVCMGAGFATMEATLILARLVRRFDFELLDAARVRPVARLTTRPAEQIMCRVRARAV